MSKKVIHTLTFVICICLVSIGNVTFNDDGINQITLRLSPEPLGILKLIRFIFVIIGVEAFSKYMTRFGK